MTTQSAPATLEALASYQAEYIERLKKLEYYDVVAPIIENFLRAIIAKGNFYLRVHLRDVEQIVMSERIKSMMETGTGATNGGKPVRQEVVRGLFGCDTSTLADEDYPKFGYLSTSNVKSDMLINSGFEYQYGGVIFKLNKTRLMHRTTMAIGDTVNFGRFRYMVPTRTDDVRATCLCGQVIADPQYASAQKMQPDPLACYACMAVAIAEGRLTPDNFANIDRILGDQMPVFEHIELQYHGLIELPEDVDGIYFCPDSAEEEQEAERLKELCSKRGIDFDIVHGLL